MGCGASSASGPDYTDEVPADGPFLDAPMALLVTGHNDQLYIGLYNRSPEPWNGKAMYRNGNGRFLYYFAGEDGGTPGWSFDHRDQPEARGKNDWYSGGFLSLEGGLAYPPIGSGLQLIFTDEDAPSEDDQQSKHRVNIVELEPVTPPPCLSIADQPDDDANGLYILQTDLWNGRPHYASSKGFHFYYYAANEGGQCGWSLHSEANPGGVKDLSDGGWVGPYLWTHPPQGNEVGTRHAPTPHAHAQVPTDAAGHLHTSAHADMSMYAYLHSQATLARVCSSASTTLAGVL